MLWPIHLRHLALKVTVLICIHLKDKEYRQSHVGGFNGPNLEVMYITFTHMPWLEICHTATPTGKGARNVQYRCMFKKRK